MKQSIPFAILLFIGGCLFGCSQKVAVSAKGPATASSKSLQNIQILFDAFDTGAYLNGPCVIFAHTGNTALRDRAGVLLSETNGEFKILTIGLEIFYWKESNFLGEVRKGQDPGSWVTEEAGREEDMLRSARRVPRSEFDDSPALELHLESKICLAHGAKATADQALQLSQAFSRRDGLDSSADLKQRLDDAAVNQLHADFGRNDFGWQDLADEFKAYLARFPNGPHSTSAKAELGILQKMVAEDTEQAGKGAGVGAKSSVEEGIKEELYRARNVSNGDFQGGRDERIVLARLTAPGLSAAPLLLEALDDPTFTRQTDDTFLHGAPVTRVITVGEIAQRALEKIASQSFDAYPGEPYIRNMKIIQRKARAWWSRAKDHGSRQALIEKVASDDLDVEFSAADLVRNYPSGALTAIPVALKKEKSLDKRRELLYQISLLNSAEGKRFLANYLKLNSNAGDRTAAAHLVLQFEPHTATDSVCADWATLTSIRQPTKTEIAAMQDEAGLLQETPLAEGRQALPAHFAAAPIDVRASILTTIPD